DKRLWAARPDVPARCVVSANACTYFKNIVSEAEEASFQVLARHTVADALAEFERGGKYKCTKDLASQYAEDSLCSK
ncbi:Rrf2 family transcriptional regulator, partial [Rahnella sp. SL6]|nr:Rrf2 family transcriptional regulator [Rahnella perminowiae]